MMLDLAIIPARGGSKGLPGKNTRPLCGHPLIAWTIIAARESGRFADVIVDTDDADIAAVAQRYGARVPFLRPAHLATDTATTVDAVLYAMKKLTVDTLALLQPTSPLRSARDIDAACDLFVREAPPAVVSVAAAKPLAWNYLLDDQSRLVTGAAGDTATRRQDAPAMVQPNGAIYITTANLLDRTHTFLPHGARAFVMDALGSIDIDTAVDFAIAEACMAARIAADGC